MRVMRGVVAGGVWFTQGDNAFYTSVYIVGGIIALWVLMMVGRSIFGRR